MSVTLVAFTVVTVILQVTFRYLLNFPLAWTEEASRLSLVASVYAGMTPAYLRGEHIVVDYFARKLPRLILRIYIMVLKSMAILISLYIAWGAYLQVTATWNMTLIAIPSVSISFIYAVQASSFLSLAAVIVLTWTNESVYMPEDKVTAEEPR